MMRPLAAALAVTLTLSACDLALPTSADEAREHLGRNQPERIVPIHLPLPEISVTLAEHLGELSEMVDTTDLSFTVDPDTFTVGLDSLLAVDPVDPAPVTEGYDLAVADFARTLTLAAPAFPVALPVPAPAQGVPLAPATPAGALPPIPVDLSSSLATATFASGSFRIVLTTDAAATITGVTAQLRDGAGVLAMSDGVVSLGPAASGTLSIPLAGITLPSSFELVLAHGGASGDLGADDLTVAPAFHGTTVAAATGVAASLLSPATIEEDVLLDFGGSDFSEAALEAGTVAVSSYDFGGLEFAPAFDGDLAGLRIGGATPSRLRVAGTVGPPAGASRVDVTATAQVTAGFTGMQVAWVVLDRVEMAVDREVDVPLAGTLDDLAEVAVGSGFLEVAVRNRLGVGGTVDLVLAGLRDAAGATVRTPVELQPSLDGSPVATAVLVDLTGTVLEPAALAPRIAGSLTGVDVRVTREAAAEAVVVDPYLEVEAREVVLAAIPETRIDLDERVAIAASDLDLGELADILDRIRFNDVDFSVTVENTTGLDVEVSDFALTLLDPAGAPLLDGAGQQATVALSTGPAGSAIAPAHAATRVDGEAAGFVNALLDRVAAGHDVEIAATGSAGAATGSGRIGRGDGITVIFAIRLGPDITVDPAGVRLDEAVHEAIQLDSVAAELMADLTEDLVSATVELEVVNGLPLGLTADLALAPTPADTLGFVPFDAAEKVEITGLAIAPAVVDGAGRATEATVSTLTAAVDPLDLDVLREGTLSMGFSARVLGPDGDRARLQPTDSLVLRPRLQIEVRTGANGGTD